jgi:hypothetical protein
VQSKTADFTFNMATPLKTVPAVGSTVTLSGTYASYTVGGVPQSAATPAAGSTSEAAPAAPAAPAQAAPAGPVMIIMSDAAVVEPKKAPVRKAPVHHSH